MICVFDYVCVSKATFDAESRNAATNHYLFGSYSSPIGGSSSPVDTHPPKNPRRRLPVFFLHLRAISKIGKDPGAISFFHLLFGVSCDETQHEDFPIFKFKCSKNTTHTEWHADACWILFFRGTKGALLILVFQSQLSRLAPKTSYKWGDFFSPYDSFAFFLTPQGKPIL